MELVVQSRTKRIFDSSALAKNSDSAKVSTDIAKFTEAAKLHIENSNNEYKKLAEYDIKKMRKLAQLDIQGELADSVSNVFSLAVGSVAAGINTVAELFYKSYWIKEAGVEKSKKDINVWKIQAFQYTEPIYTAKRLYTLHSSVIESNAPVKTMGLIEKISEILTENKCSDITISFLPKEESVMGNDYYIIKTYPQSSEYEYIIQLTESIQSQVDYFSQNIIIDFQYK